MYTHTAAENSHAQATSPRRRRPRRAPAAPAVRPRARTRRRPYTTDYVVWNVAIL